MGILRDPGEEDIPPGSSQQAEVIYIYIIYLLYTQY